VGGGGAAGGVDAFEEGGDVEGDAEGEGAAALEVDGEFDLGEEGVGGEVVGEAGGREAGDGGFAFEGEEDVAALPAPVEAVGVGMEGVVGGPLGGVGGIGGGGDADLEADGGEAFGGKAGGGGEDGGLGLGDEGEPVFGLEPGAVGAAEGEVGEEEV
jgi:hypothetical protein